MPADDREKKAPGDAPSDKNFDDIFNRFQKNIKGSAKGLLRGILIREDLEALVPDLQQGGLKVLDAGCGLGDMSLWLAKLGHQVTAADLSEKMVEHTRLAAKAEGLADRIEVQHQPLQNMLAGHETYDLICIHAVMEWLNDPYDMLALIAPRLKAGGHLSLTIYNLHRSVFNSLIKGNAHKIRRGDYGGDAKYSMTPPNPIVPERVHQKLSELGFVVERQAGLRCFYDYFSPQTKVHVDFEDVLTLERRYRMESPYRDFARYVHFVARWPG